MNALDKFGAGDHLFFCIARMQSAVRTDVRTPYEFNSNVAPKVYNFEESRGEIDSPSIFWREGASRSTTSY